ncbi:excalibur calcium-binding domain-containing protein [Aeromicrobium chenweiae]|uniref:Calcium-binding protein n=1 Tax=Aeromicrobium chenweiae TaxID=2079793 RepID=A0A2S0WN22_9ACTN|nr:excalibur calcium-binding domain-containing protein [Aeromicrobium chenweiae]AWB92711.1 calcium-binding protein [Aeromicrobium chenweiae]TGN33701.1 excalibur calcium-binding domain-containing protein [Aeromicrobium chenweiae]
MLRQLTTVVCTVALTTGGVLAVTSPAEAANKEYKNCKALNKAYKHGVGKPGAKDKTSGKPVTNFKRSSAIYKKNKKSDRDKDGIACEKR